MSIMHIVNINPSIAPSKAVTVFFQSLPFHSSDSDELWSPAILTKDKPHTPNHNTLYKTENSANNLQAKKKVPFLSTKYFSEQLRKAVLFTSRDFYDVGYFPVDSLVLQECSGWRISLARTIAEFKFQISQSTQRRLPFQEAL